MANRPVNTFRVSTHSGWDEPVNVCTPDELDHWNTYFVEPLVSPAATAPRWPFADDDDEGDITPFLKVVTGGRTVEEEVGIETSAGADLGNDDDDDDGDDDDDDDHYFASDVDVDGDEATLGAEAEAGHGDGDNDGDAHCRHACSSRCTRQSATGSDGVPHACQNGPHANDVVAGPVLSGRALRAIQASTTAAATTSPPPSVSTMHWSVGRADVMSTLQNIKSLLRGGKHAKEPTTTVDRSTAHATTQSPRQPPAPQHHGISEPAIGHQKQRNYQAQEHVSVAPDGRNQNVAANAGAIAGHAGNKNQKVHHRDDEIRRIVAEERAQANQLPKYPGLERYILREKMGDGAFSNVYRARDSQTGDEVAIKVVRKFEMNSNQGDAHLHPDFKKQPKVVERANILKEVQIMRQLEHPNIVSLIDFAESKQYYYIVLELCPGGELFHQIVRLTYFSEDLSRHVIIQVAQALLYLHEEKGVVHRDIKPENLLFYPTPFIPTKTPKPKGPDDEDKADEGEFVPGVGSGGIGRIKIADFGLSKIVWDSQTMTPCGTVGYTAPEIVKDERYSKSVDMWALGCVLYTLLCGFPPFYDESIQVLTEKVARGQYTFLSPWWDDISKSAQDLVSHLLTVDPDKRYTIEQFLAHPWVRNTREPTYAALDAPPLATPLSTRLNAPGVEQYPLGTPGTPGARRGDFRSPGAVNLREVFDVGYAVHRQEEEAKRRKNFTQGYRGAAPPGLNALNEDDDDDEDDEGVEAHQVSAKVPKGQAPSDVAGMESKLRHTNLGTAPSAAAQARAAAAPRQHGQEKGYGQHSAAVAAAAKRDVGRRNKQPFELSLDNSSILGRRNKGGAPMQLPPMQDKPSKLREELVR